MVTLTSKFVHTVHVQKHPNSNSLNEWVPRHYLLKNTERERKESSPNPELILAKTTPEERFRGSSSSQHLSDLINPTQGRTCSLPVMLIDTVDENDTIRKLTTAVKKHTKTRKLFKIKVKENNTSINIFCL